MYSQVKIKSFIKVKLIFISAQWARGFSLNAPLFQICFTVMQLRTHSA